MLETKADTNHIIRPRDFIKEGMIADAVVAISLFIGSAVLAGVMTCADIHKQKNQRPPIEAIK